MGKYNKPCLKTISADELREVIGPVQTASVELQLYLQRIEVVQLNNKTEKVVMLAEAQKPHIYTIDKIA